MRKKKSLPPWNLQFDPRFENLGIFDSQKCHIKIFGGIFSPDHKGKLSPNFEMCWTPNQGRLPSFLSPISGFYRCNHICNKEHCKYILGVRGSNNNLRWSNKVHMTPGTPRSPTLGIKDPKKFGHHNLFLIASDFLMKYYLSEAKDTVIWPL